MMNVRTLCVVGAAGFAVSAAAQDSVGTGSNNDALDSNVDSDQFYQYVVDMDSFQSSLGNTFGIAPIAKTSRDLPGDGFDGFNNHLNSGQGISRLSRSGSIFAQNSYALWENNAGAGVHVGENSSDGVTTVDRPDGVVGFTWGFSDFNGGRNNIVAGDVVFDPANPSRLYVSRGVAASSATGSTITGNATMNHAQIDAEGFVSSRIDSFNSNGTNQIAGQNFVRFDIAGRNYALVNEINGSGAVDAGASDIVSTIFNPTTSMPSAVPAGVGGPSMFAPNFNSSITFNDLDPITSTGAHLGAAPDHRGGVAVLPEAFYNGGDAITAAILSKGDESPSTQTTAVSVWGADAVGGPTASGTRYRSPSTILDPISNVNIFRSEHMFTRSQSAFSNNPPISLARDAQGNLLIATICETLNAPNDSPPDANPQAFSMATLVARVSPDQPLTADWSVAGYIDLTALAVPGKQFLDVNGVPFAELSTLAEDTNGADAGPTQSAPSFDSAGNLYWVQPVRFYGMDGVSFTDDDVIRTTIVRANYIADTGSDNDMDGTNDFGYELETLVSAGDSFSSANTGLDYTVFSFTIADSDSSSNGTFFHNNVSSSPSPAAGLADDSLGGLVFGVQVSYDVDGDGSTFDADLGQADPGDLGQTYRSLLFIAPLPPEDQITDCNDNGVEDSEDIANGTSQDVDGNGVPDECQMATRLCADQNNDGALTGADFNAFLTNFSAGNLLADVNQDGSLTGADFNAWLTAFSQGQNGPLCFP